MKDESVECGSGVEDGRMHGGGGVKGGRIEWGR